MVQQEEAVGSAFLIRVHQKKIDNLTLQYEICMRHTVKNPLDLPCALLYHCGRQAKVSNQTQLV